MSTTQWTVQGIFMVGNKHYTFTIQGIFMLGNEHHTLNIVRYIYGTI